MCTRHDEAMQHAACDHDQGLIDADDEWLHTVQVI